MFSRQTLIFALCLGIAVAAPSSNKVERKLAATLKSKHFANTIVRFHGDALATIRNGNLLKENDRAEKTSLLVSNLKALTASNQENVLRLLHTQSPFVFHTQLWISNELYIKGATVELVKQLESLPDVAEIREELVFHLEPLDLSSESAPQELGWNLIKIGANWAWDLFGNYDGRGVVVANIDTGVRATHEALRDNQRRENNWFDPYDGSSEATDSNGHGTHTMGILAGKKDIGVAPGAEWISCRGCSTASCTESALKACGQWILCPSPDCSGAPNVVSNSWGGAQGSDFYNEVIEAWKVANIIPVFANGNGGPSCQTVGSPADHDGVIAVAATTIDDALSPSTSAGPSLSGAIKPDLCAPGQNIRSAFSTSDTAYQTLSGSSMSAPHVAGVAALVLSANSSLTYDQVKHILENAASKDLPDTGRVCGGIPSTVFPNNQYGHGRVDALKSVLDVILGTR